MSDRCFDQSRETLACVSRNEWSLCLCWGCKCFGRRVKESGSTGVTLFPTHQMFATWPLQIQTERQCAFRTVLISALSVTPVPPQVCAYAKRGGHSPGDSRDTLGERCPSPQWHAQPVRRAEGCPPKGRQPGVIGCGAGVPKRGRKHLRMLREGVRHQAPTEGAGDEL